METSKKTSSMIEGRRMSRRTIEYELHRCWSPQSGRDHVVRAAGIHPSSERNRRNRLKSTHLTSCKTLLFIVLDHCVALGRGTAMLILAKIQRARAGMGTDWLDR